MNLYSWRSELLRNYGTGLLIAVAETPDGAREKIRAGFDAWDKYRYEWCTFDDPDDVRERKERRDQLEVDLRGEPFMGDHLYVAGSE